MPTDVELVVDQTRRPLRRSLGPTAWTVLEEVLLDARVVGDHLVAETSARRIAASLGLSKDTAARALLRLASAGLVVREDRRDHERGTFSGCRYVLAPEAAEVLRLPSAPPASPPPRSSSTPRDDGVAQPCLFELTNPDEEENEEETYDKEENENEEIKKNKVKNNENNEKSNDDDKKNEDNEKDEDEKKVGNDKNKENEKRFTQGHPAVPGSHPALPGTLTPPRRPPC